MKKLTLFHGSPTKFDTVKIGEELSRHTMDILAEGHGFYMIEHKEVAEAYGKYLYEISIDSDNVTDFTKRQTIRKLMETLSKKTEVPICEYINMTQFMESILSGKISVTRLYREITALLDQNEKFYNSYGHLITDEEDCLFEKIEAYFFESIKDVLKYYDMSFEKNVYICFRHPEKLKIVSMIEW